MTKIKAKMFALFLGVIMIVSVAVFATTQKNVVSHINNGVVAVADSAGEYLSGVDGDPQEYISKQGYEYNSAWVGISNASELKAFLLQNGSINGVNVKGKNGYLKTHILGFNWDDKKAPFLAPKANTDNGSFDKVLDGCGYDINFDGNPFENEEWSQTVISDLKEIRDKRNDRWHTDKLNHWLCYGGMAGGLNGEFKNFRYLIHDGRYWKERNHRAECDAGSEMAHNTVWGGLVGYVEKNGKINNVEVVYKNSAKKFGAYLLSKDDHGEYTPGFTTSTVYGGGVAGASVGTITNTKTVIEGSTMLIAQASGDTWGNAISPGWRNADVKMGGIVGWNEEGGLCDNITFDSRAYGGGLKGYTWGGQACDGFTGFIAGENTGTIKNAMIQGYLKDKIDGHSNRRAAFVCRSKQPLSKFSLNTGNDEDVYFENNSVVGKKYINSNDCAVFFDRSAENRMKVFAPSGKILWNVFGNEMISKPNELEAASVLVPTEANNIIELGESVGATVGFYNGNTKVSGNVPYKGSAYEVKMQYNGKLENVNINVVKPTGDLKTISSSEVGLKTQSTVIYADQTAKKVVLASNLQGLDSKIKIVPAQIKVQRQNFSGENTDCFANAKVSFSGLCEQDKVNGMGATYGNNEQIALNYAGVFMFTAPNNNYVFENGSSTCQIYVSPKYINVDEGITVKGFEVANGQAVINQYTEKIDLEVLSDLYGMRYKTLVADGGAVVTDYYVSNTALTAKVKITPTLTKISLGAKELKKIDVTVDNQTTTYSFGDKVVLKATEKPNKTFVGWQIGEQFVSYNKDYAFRATKNVELKSVYVDLDSASIYTHIFLDWSGNQYRKIKNAVVDMEKTQEVVLPNQLSWNFAGWKIYTKNANTTTYKPIYVYDQSVGEKVTLTQNGVAEQVEFNKEILLEKGEYSINGAKVSVGEEGLTINAITDLTIEKKAVTQTQSSSAKVVATQKDIIYVAVTFVTEEVVSDIYLDMGIAKATVDSFVQKGNVYQFVAKIQKSSMEQVFGSQATVSTQLMVNGKVLGSSFEIIREV